MTLLLAAARWFHEASLMLLFGSAALCALARVGFSWGGLRISLAAVALSGALLWFCLAAAEMGTTQSGAVLSVPLLQLVLTHSLFGQVLQARLAVLLLLLLGLGLKWRESLIALLAGAGLVLISVTSHAADASPAHFTAIGMVSDGLHFLTAGYWIGGLGVLAALHARGEQDFARVVRLFAETGIIAVAILVMTGMLNATTILLGGPGHDTPLYLAVLGAKLSLASVMIGLAIYNHVRLMPKLPERGMADRMDRNIRRELTIGLVVIGLAVVLSLLPPTLNT